MKRTDEELIVDYQQGDETALQLLYERYKRPILNFSLRILNNRADAEDVTAQVFLTLVTKRHAYHPKAKFSTWLFRVAHNNCITCIRKRKKIMSLWHKDNETSQYEQRDIPDSVDSPREKLEKSESAEYLKQAIEKLPLVQKEALILREYHALNYQQIALVLDCSLENVKILIFRARVHLRKELSSSLKEDKNG